MSKQRESRAFTLVELLVVIAIIGILIGMLLPAVQQVREAARRTQCMNQMRQMSLAMMNYESAHQHLPQGIKTGDGEWNTVRSRPGLNWYSIILPFVEQQPMYTAISNLTSGLSDPNQAYISDEATTSIPTFLCPSCPMGELNTVRPDTGRDAAKSNYVGIWGAEANGNSDYKHLAADESVYDKSTYSGILFVNSETRFGEITDGTSNTFIISERDGAPIGGDGLDRAAATWCAGKQAQWSNQCLAPVSAELDYFINTVENNNASKWNAISSQHPGGATFGRSDGSVEFVSETIGGETYESLATKAGGEVDLSF